MTRTVLVDVDWDAEAQVWIAASEAIGLFTEAQTLDGIGRKVPIIAADLLDDPDGDLKLNIELIVKFNHTLSAAA